MNKYKTYIIGGVPRAGKSTLQKKILEQYNIPGITTDLIRDSLYETYPEHHDFKDGPDIYRAKGFSKLWESIIHNRRLYQDNLLIEGVNFLPETLNKFKKLDYVEIYFLIYPKIAQKELYDRVRKYDSKHSWTAECSDEEIKNLCKVWINDSKFLKEECEKYGIKYFDTSNDFEKVINNAVKIIINN